MGILGRAVRGLRPTPSLPLCELLLFVWLQEGSSQVLPKLARCASSPALLASFSTSKSSVSGLWTSSRTRAPSSPPLLPWCPPVLWELLPGSCLLPCLLPLPWRRNLYCLATTDSPRDHVTGEPAGRPFSCGLRLAAFPEFTGGTRGTGLRVNDVMQEGCTSLGARRHRAVAVFHTLRGCNNLRDEPSQKAVGARPAPLHL
eukprot:scaffold1794_cov390-Prasinococcus_capsulatus_cf.AAC.5